MFEMAINCPPRCEAQVTQLPLPGTASGSVNAQGDLPATAKVGEKWIVLTPPPPSMWFWNGSTWVAAS